MLKVYLNELKNNKFFVIGLVSIMFCTSLLISFIRKEQVRLTVIINIEMPVLWFEIEHFYKPNSSLQYEAVTKQAFLYLKSKSYGEPDLSVKLGPDNDIIVECMTDSLKQSEDCIHSFLVRESEEYFKEKMTFFIKVLDNNIAGYAAQISLIEKSKNLVINSDVAIKHALVKHLRHELDGDAKINFKIKKVMNNENLKFKTRFFISILFALTSVLIFLIFKVRARENLLS